MNKELFYTVSEVAELTGKDAQTIRNQIRQDFKDGCNDQNYNAIMGGSNILIPKKWFDKKIGIGPVFELGEKIAEWLVAHGWAVNAEVQDDQG